MSHRMDDIFASVEGGVAKSIDDIVADCCNCALEDLSGTEQTEIDEVLFTCGTCDWTMKREDDESDDDGICRECYDVTYEDDE